jgi:GNAT superfamily N-acetyltransferase
MRTADLEAEPIGLPGGYVWKIWHPGIAKILPAGVPLLPFGVWWIFYILAIFRNNGYGIFLIYNGRDLVHRSVIFPKYFRFPFMRQGDLQIGDTWTNFEHRSRGLGSYALQQIIRSEARIGRRFWYLTEEDNKPSIHVATNAGFYRFGRGARFTRLGLLLLGSYRLLELIDG